MAAVTGLARSIKRRRGFVRLLWIGTILLNLFVIATVALVVTQNREREIAQARVQTDNYSRMLESTLAGQFDKIDITLLTVRDEVARQNARGGVDEKALTAFLARQDSHIPEALGVRVIDKNGIVRYAAEGDSPSNINIAASPGFLLLRDDPDAGLVFSKPIMGAISKKWIVTLGRRIENADGSFAGAVHAAVAIDHFISLFSGLDLGEQGNVGLWDKKNLIARYSRNDTQGATVGANTPSAQLRGLLDAEHPSAIYHARSGVDGITRTYHFRRVNNYPLFLVVGLADEDYLSEWRRDTLAVSGLVGLFVLATLVAARLIYGGWKRREADHDALLDQEAEYTAKLERSNRDAESARERSELILSSAAEGICGVDVDGKVIFVNPAARKMFGWEDGEGVGLDLHASVHHHAANGNPALRSDCPAFKTLLDGQWRQVKDDLYWRKDGSSFPVEYTVAAMRQDGRISGMVNVFRDITERKKLEERIHRMALVDELTGLHNRSFLSDALARVVAASARRLEAVAILFLDLDGFKGVNDEMGHAAGDSVLREVAARLRSCVRAEDVLVRMGGDEFLVVTQSGKGEVQENGVVLARRIIDAIHQPIVVDGGIAQVGASIGIAIYPDSGTSIEHSIQIADSAMYQAKNAGKGCYVMADGLAPAMSFTVEAEYQG